MTTDTDIEIVPRVIKAMKLTYGRLIPGSAGKLPELDEHLVAGARVTRGLSREFGPTSVEFALGDVVVDRKVRVLAGRIGYQLVLEELVDAFDSYDDEFRPTTTRREQHVTAAFAVGLDDGLVLLEDVGELFPADNLVQLLSDFVNTSTTLADRQMVGASLHAVEETPWDFLARIDLVVRVRFQVTPSNPGNPRWSDYDATLADARAKSLKAEFENENGLNVPKAPGPHADQNPIGLGLAMNDAGYGAPSYLRIDGRFRDRPASYVGTDQSSFLYEEIDADTLREEDADGVLRRVAGLLGDALTSGLLTQWLAVRADGPAQRD